MKRIDRKYLVGMLIILVILLICLKRCGSAIEKITRNPGAFKSEPSYMVPLNATFIACFNLEKVLSEINYESLRRTPDYISQLKKFYTQNPPMAEVFANPTGAGIDTKSTGIFYIDVGTKEQEIYSAYLLQIGNIQAFEAMVSKSVKKKHIDEKGYKVLKFNEQLTMAWNENVVLFLTCNIGFEPKNVIYQVFEPTAKKYFDDHNDFLSYTEKSEADMTFRIDLTSYARNQIHATGKPGEFSKVVLEENTLFGEVDFGDGYADASILFDLNKLVKSGLDKVFKPDFDPAFIKYLPADITPSFVSNVSLNFNGLLSLLLQTVDLKVQARNEMAEYGLMLEDFDKAFTGDVLLVSYPNDTTTKSSVAVGFKVKDKSHFFKIIDVMHDLGNVELEDHGIYKMVKGGTVPFFPVLPTYPDKLNRMILKGDYLYSSLDKNIIEKIRMSDGTNGLSFSQTEDLSKEFFYASGSQRFEKVVAITDKYSIKDYTANFNGKKLDLHFGFLNANKSALKQLLNLP